MVSIYSILKEAGMFVSAPFPAKVRTKKQKKKKSQIIKTLTDHFKIFENKLYKIGEIYPMFEEDQTLNSKETLKMIKDDLFGINYKLINFDELPSFIVNYFKDGKFFDHRKFICAFDDKEQRYSIKFFTDLHEYTISAKLPDQDNGYLGAIVRNRKSKAGETWRRGSDLPDGELNLETLKSIFVSIVNHELNQINI